MASKIFKTECPHPARVNEARIISAMRHVGYRSLSEALEYSPAWLTGFTQGDGALTLEGVCRLLHALDLNIGGESHDQLILNDVAASALRQSVESLGRHAPVGETVMLTDEEFFQLKSLAQIGARHLFERIETVTADKRMPALRGVA